MIHIKKIINAALRQAADIDRRAASIFRVTRATVSLVLLCSLALLIAAQTAPADGMLLRSLGEALCHASFRIAAIGVTAGFAADITAGLSGNR